MRSRYSRFSSLLVSLVLGCAGTAVAQEILSNSSASVDATTTSTVGSAASSTVSATPISGQSGGSRRMSTGMQFAGSGAFGVSSRGWGAPSSVTGISSMGVKASPPSEKTPGTGLGRGSLNSQQLSALSAITSKNSAVSTKTPLAIRASGSGVYSTGFPDSTKGTAVLSPSQSFDSSIFNFTPSIHGETIDLSTHEFLAPSLQVGAGTGSASRGKQDDIYKKLRRYLDASHKNSLKSKSSKHTPAMADPLKKSSSLKSAKSSGLIF